MARHAFAKFYLSAVLMLAAALPISAPVATAAVTSGPRLALVIGNSAYATLPRHETAMADAQLVAAALRDRGFSAELQLNLSRHSLQAIIKAFGARVARAGKDATAVIYFAGHGAGIDGTDAMLPIDARLTRGGKADSEVVPLGEILRALGRTRDLTSLIFIDAPRDNPWRARLQRPWPLRLGQGMLLSQATRSERPLAPVDGAHSHYAQALADAFRQPGLRLPQFLRKLRADVMRASGGRQLPADEAAGTIKFNLSTRSW